MFDILTTRPPADDDRMYPTIHPATGAIRFGPDDGNDIITIALAAARVECLTRGRWSTLCQSPSPARMHLTGSRLVVSCPATAGRALPTVGQIRFPWIRMVGWRSRGLFLTADRVIVVIQDGTVAPSRTLGLQVRAHGPMSAAPLALAIVSRVLAHGRPDKVPRGESQWAPEDLLGRVRGELNRVPARGFSFYTLPTSWDASPDTAGRPPDRPHRPPPAQRQRGSRAVP